ncbi:MAG: aminomethyl-transferring glycine dehydrogenase subunit GcvPA [Desulfurococcaceae archaeon]
MNGTHPWIPSFTREQVEKMLRVVGVKSVEELFSDVPVQVRIPRELWEKLNIGVGRPLSEIEARRIIEKKLSKNANLRSPPFMGGGVYPHYVPPLVKYIVSRGEFLTAYTPYQAEISQGLMQALFEYQSLIAELLEMDVVNASMYDWGSAAAEAVLMALRVNKGRKKVILPANMNPFHRKVVETYTHPHSIILVTVPYDRHRGVIDLEELKKLVDEDTAAIYLQYPNFFGVVESEAKAVGEIAHEKKALFITGVYPIALGLLKSPGELGADIAVGEGQPLGLGLNYGGPYLGIFATRFETNLLRQMPGRIMGLAESRDGERAFAMILQTREQHIRREKATSNICTNEALVAIAAAVYLSMLGKNGIVKLAETNYYIAHYAWKKMKEVGLNVEVFEEDFFNEFLVSFNETGLSYTNVHEKLLHRGVHGGLYIKDFYPELGETALFAFTELHLKDDIDFLVKSLAEITGNGDEDV